MYKRAAPSVNI